MLLVWRAVPCRLAHQGLRSLSYCWQRDFRPSGCPFVRCGMLLANCRWTHCTWSERVGSRCQAHNSVLFEHQGFVHLSRASEVHEWISVDQRSSVPLSQGFCCEGTFLSCDFCLHVSAETSAIDFLLQHFRGPNELVKQIYFRADDAKFSMTMPIGLLVEQAHDWHIVLASVCLGQCQFSRICPTEIIEISPTLPFAPQQTIHINPRLDFDIISQIRWF